MSPGGRPEAGLAVARDISQVDSMASQIEKETTLIEDLTKQLTVRLEQVLRAEPTRGADPANKPPQPNLVPHAERLRNTLARLTEVAQALDSMVTRLEL